MHATTASDAQALDRLNHSYPGWHIWRSFEDGYPQGWVATNRDRTSVRVPTLHGETADELERQLRNPPRRVGGTPSS